MCFSYYSTLVEFPILAIMSITHSYILSNLCMDFIVQQLQYGISITKYKLDLNFIICIWIMVQYMNIWKCIHQFRYGFSALFILSIFIQFCIVYKKIIFPYIWCQESYSRMVLQWSSCNILHLKYQLSWSFWVILIFFTITFLQ